MPRLVSIAMSSANRHSTGRSHIRDLPSALRGTVQGHRHLLASTSAAWMEDVTQGPTSHMVSLREAGKAQTGHSTMYEYVVVKWERKKGSSFSTVKRDEIAVGWHIGDVYPLPLTTSSS